MTDLKLCKDCKWYKKDWFSHLSGAGDCDDRCFNPVLSENLITGKKRVVVSVTIRDYLMVDVVKKVSIGRHGND